MYCGVTEQIQSGRGFGAVVWEKSSEPEGRKCSLSFYYLLFIIIYYALELDALQVYR